MPPSKPPKIEANALSEQFLAQVSESLQMVFDLASRVDERVKIIFERQQEIESRLTRMSEAQTELVKRLSVLETESNKQDEMDDEAKKALENLRLRDQEIRNYFHALELKMEGVSLRLGNHDTRWQKAFDIFWKLALTLIAGWILYKLGLK